MHGNPDLKQKKNTEKLETWTLLGRHIIFAILEIVHIHIIRTIYYICYIIYLSYTYLLNCLHFIVCFTNMAVMVAFSGPANGAASRKIICYGPLPCQIAKAYLGVHFH